MRITRFKWQRGQKVIKKLGEGLAKTKDYTKTKWKFTNLKANIKTLLGNGKERLTHSHIEMSSVHGQKKDL